MRRNRMNLGIVIALEIVIAVYSTAVLADDYKEATEAAYCDGVYRSNIEHFRTKSPKADTQDQEIKKFRKQTFVAGAVRRQIIDWGTATKMRDVGYADGNLCWQGWDRCEREAKDREQQMDEERNNKMALDCLSLFAGPACDRAFKNCD
jgi:hypothetical protein